MKRNSWKAVEWLGVLLMALGVGMIGGHALAGEVRKGTILASDAGSSSNVITGYGTAGCADVAGQPGACDKAFALACTGVGTFLTIQCDQAALLSTDEPYCDAGTCVVELAAKEKFFTRMNGCKAISVTPDGGTYDGGLLSIAPVPGATTARCKVSVRSGNE